MPIDSSETDTAVLIDFENKTIQVHHVIKHIFDLLGIHFLTADDRKVVPYHIEGEEA